MLIRLLCLQEQQQDPDFRVTASCLKLRRQAHPDTLLDSIASGLMHQTQFVFMLDA